MKKRTTFATLFWIYKSRAKDGIAPVYVRITVNGVKAEAGIKRMVPVDLWDQKSGRAIGTSTEVREINQFLELIRKKIYDAYQDLLFENADITAKAIRNRYLGLEEPKEEEKTLLELIDYHNERNRDVLEWSILKNYFTTRKYIEKFIRQKLKIKEGYTVINRYSHGSYYRINGTCFPKIYCFDDLGIESNIKYYGNHTNVMAWAAPPKSC